MLSVSVIIPAWNEEEHIADCLLCATRQSVPAKEILVVDNNSTDGTVSIVERFIDEHPDAHVRLLHQDAEQGLIPTRNYGLNHATGDILGRVDADSMLRPDWVEQAIRIFTEHPDVMGATGPVAYYDMPAAKVSLKGDNAIRKHIYKADGGQSLLFGSNMALRATAWKVISSEVCRDKADIMHEDIDVSLHLFSHDFRTYYSRHLVVAISARRMDTSFASFSDYMDRFHNTFAAHPSHTRTTKPEYLLTAMYPWLHMMYPGYQRYLRSTDTNPAERVWEKQQMQLLQDDQEADTDADADGSDRGDDGDPDELDEQTAMDELSPAASQINSFFADLFRPSPQELERRRQKREIRRQKSELREESKQIKADKKVAMRRIKKQKQMTTKELKARSKRVRTKIKALNQKSSRI
jgi:glycosyltransferase involved in cell wall biosynthesis